MKMPSAITALFERRGTSGNPTPNDILSLAGLYSTPASSGIPVSARTALKSIAVFACVRLLSETLGSLPLHVYKNRDGGGKEKAETNRLYSLLHDQTNPVMSAMTFRETLEGHVETWGNGYAEIQRDDAGRVVALWPLRPDRTRAFYRINKAGVPEKFYTTTLGAFTTSIGDVTELGGTTGTTLELAAENVFHVPGWGYDGVQGYSPITLAREGIGLALATEQFGAMFFGNGARPGGYLTTPNKLSDEAYKRLAASWQQAHQGLSNAQRSAILEEGVTYNEVGVPPDDAQFLQTREYQTGEIARLFGVPRHMIQDTEKTTSWGTGVEQMSIGFVVYTMRPRLVRWEQALKAALFSTAAQSQFFAEFAVDGLMRGDQKARYDSYNIGWGKWLNTNDIRALENLNPIGSDGDVFLWPLNMAPAERIISGEVNEPGRPGPLATDAPTVAPGAPAVMPSALNALPRQPAGAAPEVRQAARAVLRDAELRVIHAERRDIEKLLQKNPLALGDRFEEFLATAARRNVGYLESALANARACGVASDTADDYAARHAAEVREAFADLVNESDYIAQFDTWEREAEARAARAVLDDKETA